MSSEDTKVLELNDCKKPCKTPFITYADFKYLMEKIDGCKNNFSEYLREHAMKIINFNKKNLHY